MLRKPLPALPTLRHGLVAGEPLRPTLRQAWRDATGTDLHEALGMSECSTYVSGSPTRPAPEGAVGYPQTGRRIRRDSTGALGIHRDDPGLMLGYLSGGETQLPLSGEWFVTGDLVAQDEDGAIRFLGRADDQMNAGGFRLSPLEVEAAFADLPETEVAAFAAEIKPGVFVVALAHQGASDEASLTARAEAALAPYKRPRLYLPVVALPRSANGKLNRKALPDLLKERPI